MPLYELTLNLRGKRCLLLPKRSESYSFRCLNKPIFNRKFISNFPQQIDRFLINLLIRARLISHGGVVVTLCRKISSVNGHTSFSVCNVINPSGRWKKMKRVWFKWKVRRIRLSSNLPKVSNTILATFNTISPKRIFCFYF